MANNSGEHSIFGLTYLKKLRAIEEAWVAHKASDDPRDRELANKLSKMRRRYREKYRPLPYEGVSLGRSERLS
jgi:hypothetical protein